MQERSAEASELSGSNQTRPLAGETAWLISDGKAGHEAQSLGIVEALGMKHEWKRVAPRGVWRALSPWTPVSPVERFGKQGSEFTPPWPKLAIAVGRTTIPYLRALRRRAGLKTFTLVLLDPKVGAGAADLFWVPEHDKRRGPNVFVTLTSPHRFSPSHIAALRQRLPAEIIALPCPRIAVLLGGPNDHYRFTEGAQEHLVAALAALAATGASLMITSSRRTPSDLTTRVSDAVKHTAHILWTGGENNPYPHFLAAADRFVVTADSVNMVGEAAATGRPIHVFYPEGGARKFDHYHGRLEELGVTRPLEAPFDEFEDWAYTPLSSAENIAAEIERRVQKRRFMLGSIAE